MKKRMISLLLALVMVLGMLPAATLTANAAAADSVWVGGVEMTNNTYLAVGATATQTTKPSGGYAYYEDGTLTLNNYSYEGEGYLYSSKYGYYATVFAVNDLTLELVGTNTLTQTEENSYVINVRLAYLTVDGNGKLIGTADDSKGLRADGDLTINGGTVEVSAESECIFSSNDIIINDGDITAESKDRIGIWSSSDITINGGNVTATGGFWAIEYDYDFSGSFTVAEGMKIQASTTVDGELGEYVAANHRSYKKIVITEKSVNPFTDVPAGSWFEAPVLWALENGITEGTSATTFAPGDKCLRAHVVTFLWKAEKSPEPSAYTKSFKDVPSGAWYYKPVHWAVEHGITSGTSDTTFGAADVCSRYQVVYFLWAAAGKPEPKTTHNPFTDVKTSHFFYKAVLWAVENGITSGTSDTTFSPTTPCNRAQVVTFLYKAYN